MKTRLLLKGLLLLTGLMYSQIYVDAGATGLNNGSTWTNAYTSLESALTAATTGNQIWIARGSYVAPADGYSISNEDLEIYGGFAGTELATSDRVFGTNETILTGDVDGNDVNESTLALNLASTTKTYKRTRVVDITATGENLLLDGLTVSGVVSTSYGGAVYKAESIKNLIINNLMGQQVLTTTKSIINVSNLASGIYMDGSC